MATTRVFDRGRRPGRPPALRNAGHDETVRPCVAAAGRGRREGGHRVHRAHRGRLHRLHLEPLPAHRRRALAGAAADDQERGARDGRGHRVRGLGRPAAAQGRTASSSRAPRSAAGRRGRRPRSITASSRSRPAVIDLLNVEPSFIHHCRAYGAWSDAVKDYVEQGIMDWIGTPQFRALMKIEEPYEYRERLTMPKFMRQRVGRSVLPARLVAVLLRRAAAARSTCATCRTPTTRSTSRTRSKACRRSTRPIVQGHAAPASSRGRSRRTARSRSWRRSGPTTVDAVAGDEPDARNFRLDVIGSGVHERPR